MTTWKEHQVWEKEWHGNCVNSFNEERKQLVYAEKMGLRYEPDSKTPFRFNLNGKSVLDIGGGPYSLLLKCFNFSKAVVIDPTEYPDWVHFRYLSAGIKHIIRKAEEINPIDDSNFFDEVWMYNVLQHTEDPEKIIANARKISKIIRVCEWVETKKTLGHPHSFTKEQFDELFGGIGKTELLTKDGCNGKAYFGIFKGNHYDEGND